MTKRVTIKDIARHLKITPSTVSRALAGNTRISNGTREKVLSAAKDMGYEPNMLASSLRKGTSDVIGMIVPGINRSFFSNVISSVEEELNHSGFNLIIVQTHENSEKEKRAVQTLLRNRVGGVIISLTVQTQDYGHLKEIVKRGIPLVQFDRVNKNIKGPKIVNDNFNGAYSATRHLLKSGYKKIVHFTGSLNLNVYSERLEGYKKALSERGIEFDEKMVFENSITRETGKVNITKAIKEFGADALFSSGDFSALGALEKLRDMNLTVPEQFGVVGFANEPFAELMEPSLSSVDQNPHAMGVNIAQTLIRLMQGESYDENILIPVQLIARESSLKKVVLV